MTGAVLVFALTFSQPFATLVALGLKRLDTRPFGTAWRGLLAIHAASAFPDEYRALCMQEPYRSSLASAGFESPDSLATGSIVGFCYLEDSGPVTPTLVSPSDRFIAELIPGQTAYLFSGALPLKTAVPLREGNQVWPVNITGFPWAAVAEQVMRQRTIERATPALTTVTAAEDGLQVIAEADLWEIGGPDAWRLVTTNLTRKGKRSVTGTRSGGEATDRYPWLPEWYDERRRAGQAGVVICKEQDAKLVLFPEHPESQTTPSMPFLATGLQQLRAVQRELDARLVMPIPGFTEQRPISEKVERLNIIRHYLSGNPVTVVVATRKRPKANPR